MVSPAARQVVIAANQVCGVELKVRHLEPTRVPPLPQEVAAVHWFGLAAEQERGEHCQKARKPQLTCDLTMFSCFVFCSIAPFNTTPCIEGNRYEKMKTHRVFLVIEEITKRMYNY